MPWPCVLYESFAAAKAAKPVESFAHVGAMWPADENWRALPSTEYRADAEGKRPMLWVMLPSGPFCIDQRSSRSEAGWKVTGDAPQVTLTPSINVMGAYHGWITDGVITDDCEGRTFPEASA